MSFCESSSSGVIVDLLDLFEAERACMVSYISCVYPEQSVTKCCGYMQGLLDWKAVSCAAGWTVISFNYSE